jgi:hypothetical protein
MRRHASLVESEQDSLGFDPFDGEAGDLGQSADRIRITEMDDPRDRRDRSNETFDLESGPLLFIGDLDIGECGGCGAKADAGEDVLQTGPSGPFLIAAGQERLEAQAAPNVEHARPDRTSEPVAAE